MQIINLGILAHVDAGKTTLTEALLYHSGVIRKMGRVDHGTTITDSMEIEQKRGMTIRSSTVSFTWNHVKINLIDTPGHFDFIAEVERSLAVMDGVILVISAKEGIQPQTRVIFRKLQELKIPAIIFVNKVDRMGICIKELYEDMKRQLTASLLRMQKIADEGSSAFLLETLPFSEKSLQESLLDFSEELMTKFITEEALSNVDYQSALVSLVQKANIAPVFFGSALNDRGICELLDAITLYFNTQNQDMVDSPLFDCSDLSAFIYKVEWDNKRHKLIYFRVFNGNMLLRTPIEIADRSCQTKIYSMLALSEGKRIPADIICNGDIGIILDIQELHCLDYLGKKPEKFCNIQLAEPLLSASVLPATLSERRELLEALQILAEEDPLLKINISQETLEIRLQLFGQLQMDVLKTILAERFHLKAAFAPLVTIFKEQPGKTAEAEIRICSSSNPYYAGIRFSVSPLPTGSGIEYENKVSYGYLEKSFQNAVWEGIEKSLKEGIHGYEITNLKVTFLEADYDSVSGTPADFRKLASKVLKLALEASDVQLLEPWEQYELVLPTGLEKKIFYELQKRRAKVEDILYEADLIWLKGVIPADTSKDLAFYLSTWTDGKGEYYSKFYQFILCGGDSIL